MRRNPFKLTTRYTRGAGALAARGRRPVSTTGWQPSSPGSFWDGEDVSFLIGTWARLPKVEVSVLAPQRLPFDNTALVIPFESLSAISSRWSGPPPPPREGMEWGAEPEGKGTLTAPRIKSALQVRAGKNMSDAYRYR